MTKRTAQFNFKLPEDLLKQLRALAKAKDVTTTELVIQGIRHVLGFKPENSLVAGIDSQLYQQLDKVEQRIQDFTDYQSAVDIETDKRIKVLEETVEALKAKLSTLELAQGNDSRQKLDTNLDAQLGDQRDEAAIANSDSGNNLDNQLHEPVEPSEVQEVPPETTATQLELVNLKELNATKTVDSIEMLAALRAEDPQGNWTNEQLTSYRRNKGLKDKWHDIGMLRFKYLKESKDIAKSRKTIHLWQMISTK